MGRAFESDQGAAVLQDELEIRLPSSSHPTKQSMNLFLVITVRYHTL